MTLRLAALLGALSFAAPATAQSLLAREFSHRAEIEVTDDGLVPLELPEAVLATARPDLADVRIVDRAGREVPFFVRTWRPQPHGEPLEIRVRDVQRSIDEPEGGTPRVRERYELELTLPAHGPTDVTPPAATLEIATSQPRFVRRARIERDGALRPAAPTGALTPGPAPEGGVEEVPLFRVEAAERTSLLLRPLAARFALTIEGDENFYLDATFRARTKDRDVEPTVVVPLTLVGSASEGGATTLELARPLGLVPEALHFDADDEAFARRVQVVEREGEPRVLGAGGIVRIPRVADSLDVALSAAARADRLFVRIEDRDSPPLRGARVSARVPRPALVFALADHADGQPDATLYFGSAQTFRPNYDLASLAELTPSRAELERSLVALDPRGVTLGEVRSNPAYAPTPALSFAMQPGAPLDARSFRWRRALTIAPTANGLSRYRLAPEDVAAARVDLADLRVVDAQGAQWPLLLAPEAAREWRDAALTVREREGRTSEYDLALPAEGVRVTALELEASAPFFDRAHRVTTRDANGTERALASGRLARDPARRLPLRIALGGDRVAQLTLAIDDGDDAPLAFSRASVQLVLPELFVTAPPGEYALLLGDDEASAPQYELERMRELVLAVPSGGAQAGPLEANPVFSSARSLSSGVRGRTLAVWLVLGAAVVALALLTLRAARREEPSPPAS